MSRANRCSNLLVLSTIVLLVVGSASMVEAFDTEGEFVQGTKIFGLQVGGGEQNNVEGQRTISDISFLNITPRFSYLPFRPFGSGLLRSAVEPGLEGWFQYYLALKQATAEGLKLALRYHLIGFGRLVPYLEVTAGAAGTSLHVVLEAGAGMSCGA